MHRLTRFAAATTAMALLSTLTISALAADGHFTKLAKRLATLRGEVETLSENIETQKTQSQQKLRSIATQKADLDIQVQKETLRLKQLRQARQKHLDRVAKSQPHHSQLKPTVLGAIAQVRAHVNGGLPFKKDARLSELRTIETQLNKGMLAPQKASARLWQFYEDEMRLTRESGLYRQTIEIDDQQMLVDVARLGMVAMYFKAQDGRVGYAVRKARDWRFVTVNDEASIQQINTLFDAFKKNIRVGYFTLPEAFVVGGGK